MMKRILLNLERGLNFHANLAACARDYEVYAYARRQEALRRAWLRKFQRLANPLKISWSERLSLEWERVWTRCSMMARPRQGSMLQRIEALDNRLRRRLATATTLPRMIGEPDGLLEIVTLGLRDARSERHAAMSAIMRRSSAGAGGVPSLVMSDL